MQLVLRNNPPGATVAHPDWWLAADRLYPGETDLPYNPIVATPVDVAPITEEMRTPESAPTKRYSSQTFQELKMAVEIRATYTGTLGCEAVHGPSHKTLRTDAPLDNGGKGESFSPTDLVATALGTCVLTILGLVSQRHDLELTGTTVQVTKEMIQQPVRRIGALKTVVSIPSGVTIDDAMKSRLESAARKCPVHQSLHPDIHSPIEFVYE